MFLFLIPKDFLLKFIVHIHNVGVILNCQALERPRV